MRRRHDLLRARGGVESPALRLPDERHRERPVFIAHDKRLRTALRVRQGPSFRGRRAEHFAATPRTRRIGGIDQLLPLGPEDLKDVVDLFRCRRRNQRLDGVLGRGEASRRSGFRPATGRAGGEASQRPRARRPGVRQLHETLDRSALEASFVDAKDSQDSHGRTPLDAQRRRLPELRELLRLLFPRWLAFRSDLPLE